MKLKISSLDLENLALEGRILEKLLLNSVANDKKRILSWLRPSSHTTKRILNHFRDYENCTREVGLI